LQEEEQEELCKRTIKCNACCRHERETQKEREREREKEQCSLCALAVGWCGGLEELNAAYADHVLHRSWSFVGD
jgi:hypothetical protein